MLLSAKYLRSWRKRSVLFGVFAMVVGALWAFDVNGAPVRDLVRVVLGLDLLVVAALAVVFARLTGSSSALS